MFENISSLHIAKIFVHAKKDKIAKLLKIDVLDTYNAADIVFKFIFENKDIFWDNYANKYDLLFDEVFFAQAVEMLKKAKRHGVKISGCPQFPEPNIMYVS